MDDDNSFGILPIGRGHAMTAIPPHSIILGTAQLGQVYGVYKREEAPSTAQERVEFAISNGFAAFDTAPQYAQAESILGKSAGSNARIFTKTPHLEASMTTTQRQNLIEIGLQRSLERLQVTSVEGLLLHSPDRFDGAVMEALLQQKQSGRVKKVGVSVYDQQQIEKILDIWKPDIIQLPASIADQRLIKSGVVDHLRMAGIEVHIRSVFLQGVLLADVSDIPGNLERLRPVVRALEEEARQKKISRAALCVGFIAAAAGGSCQVIGLQSNKQLLSLAEALETARSADCADDCSIDDPVIVNPMYWQ